jgi:hypothetical protein
MNCSCSSLMPGNRKTATPHKRMMIAVVRFIP